MALGNALTPDSNVPIGAGIDCLLLQDGKIVSYATEVNINEDYMLEAIRCIGEWAPLGFKSMGYDGNVSVGTYLVREENAEGSLITPGWSSDGMKNTINTAGYFDFVILDIHTLNVLATAIGCKISSAGYNFQTQGLNTKTTEWKMRKLLPGIHTS